MPKTKSATPKQKTALNGAKLLLICLIATLTNCAGAPKFPTDRVWEADVRNGVCGEYKITNPQKMQIVFVQDHALSKCDGVFGFSAKDIPKVLDWGVDMQAYAKEKCGK